MESERARAGLEPRRSSTRKRRRQQVMLMDEWRRGNTSWVRFRGKVSTGHSNWGIIWTIWFVTSVVSWRSEIKASAALKPAAETDFLMTRKVQVGVRKWKAEWMRWRKARTLLVPWRNGHCIHEHYATPTVDEGSHFSRRFSVIFLHFSPVWITTFSTQ